MISIIFLGGNSLLEYIINDHNSCCVILDRINRKLKFISVMLYYSAISSIDLVIILSLQEEVGTFNRILAFTATVLGALLLLIFTYSISLVPREAHRSYNKLCSLMVRRPTEVVLKLKVLGLIEKLSGPNIGFYCSDLFPFTNYEFYLFVANCAKNFILYMGLFSK